MSPRAKAYWTVRAAIRWLVVIAIELVIALSGPGLVGSYAVVMVVTLAAAAAVHLVVMPRWRFLVHRWEVTTDAVYTQVGWFSQERRIAPRSRIQTVDSHRGPLEQIFGLANVTVTTASAAGPLRIHGLARERADQIVDGLTVAGDAADGDAT